MHPKQMLAAALVAAFTVGSAAGAQPADTTKVSRKPLFTETDAIAAGAFVVGTILMYPADRHFAESLQGSPQSNRLFHHAATDVRLIAQPGSLIIGGSMYAIGRLTSNEKLADLGLHGTEAIVVGGGVATLIKGVAGRARPLQNVHDPKNFKLLRGFNTDSDAYKSFPSGHTTAAFAAAAAVTAETARWWPSSRWYIGPAMYGGATLVGLSRMYNNKHWASDVVMGAAIGTFSGVKIVRYHHSHPGNRLDKWLLGASIAPGTNGGTAVAISFIPQ